MTQFGFEGQVAIVTGGGRNLGRGYCIDLARRGAAVVVNDIDGDAADAVVGEIERAGGTAIASHEAVESVEGGNAIVAKAVEHFGTVDVLVNNAGNVRAKNFDDLTLEDFEAVLKVNLSGTFCVTKPAWAIMREKRHGRIVMSSSAAGVYPEQGYSEYATAKAGTIGLMRALASEGREHGIHVNAISPQAGGTAMTAEAGPIASLAKPEFAGPEASLAPYKSVDAVSPLVVYLCSPACRVTGVAFTAGCGWFARNFVGLTSGWTAPELGVPPTVEELARHVDEIVAAERFELPEGASDELRIIAERLGLAVAGSASA